MLKIGRKSALILIAVFAFCTCIDPYKPDLRGYESLLVVDGLLTDQNASYAIKLSRTMTENTPPPPVTDAAVFITDNVGGRYSLKHYGEGIYKTDSTEFNGAVGKTYILHIITNDDEEYESDSCRIESVPDIDSIYFQKDEELVNNETEREEGLRIYLDSSPGDIDTYYRWEFEETWRFKIPDPVKREYINENFIITVPEVKEYCWKNKNSDDVLIRRIYTGESPRVLKEPIFFIATGRSDRLLIQYSILVKQFSISKKEFDFWNNLKKVNESGSDIFARQPFTVISNIHNIHNPGDRVLGYFKVSSVKEKRKNIAFNEIVGLNLPLYRYPCARIEDSPYIKPWVDFTPPMTWDDLYYMYTSSGYSFVEASFTDNQETELYRMIFVRNAECVNCELTGTTVKPEFWSDLN